VGFAVRLDLFGRGAGVAICFGVALGIVPTFAAGLVAGVVELSGAELDGIGTSITPPSCGINWLGVVGSIVTVSPPGIATRAGISPASGAGAPIGGAPLPDQAL